MVSIILKITKQFTIHRRKSPRLYYSIQFNRNGFSIIVIVAEKLRGYRIVPWKGYEPVAHCERSIS